MHGGVDAMHQEQVAQALRRHAVQDPYILLLGPDNQEQPGLYLVRVMLTVPEDQPTGDCWTASSLERARQMIPPALTRRPAVRTTPQPGLLEQWGMTR